MFISLTLLSSGLYEYRISNTFGATAFCSYGAFWCSYAGYVYFIVPSLPADKVHEASGLFLLMWLIFTLYMTAASFRVSLVLAVLFVVLSITFLLLCIGDFAYVSPPPLQLSNTPSSHTHHLHTPHRTQQ